MMKGLIIILVALFLVVNVFGKERVKEKEEIVTNNINEFDNYSTVASIDNPSISKYIQVQQNYPNPFYSTTVIEYYLPEQANTLIQIYNSMGELIITLENSIKQTGNHSIEWNRKDSHGDIASPGLYYYVIATGNDYTIKKMILIN